MMIDKAARWPAATFVRLILMLLVTAVLSQPASAQLDPLAGWVSKLDPLLRSRLSVANGRSKIVVRVAEDASLDSIVAIIEANGGTRGRALPIINSQSAEIPHTALSALASSPLVQRISLDRLIVGALDRTGPTVAAPAVWQSGYDGAGVGVAVIDSGITSWHDDLADATGAQRVDAFVDFVNGHATPYDDYGHGTHVAGIIAGNGFDSGGRRTGIAPRAHLIVLKVLDESGKGRISDVIAALGYAVAHKDQLNIRVVNLSVATGVYESYNHDPLTLAAQRAVMAGIVVVAAAGNNGRNPEGREHFGGVTAPGNAPWVVTVGASSHMGTVDGADDRIAAFSSRGPAAIDFAAKPDVVAPGVGTGSLSDPNSALYAQSRYRLDGTVPTSYLPYLSLSGTSMAAPVVSATVALMVQANSALTPNQVKAILQYTAQIKPSNHPLRQGAGLVNAKSAVKLARFFGASPSGPYPSSSTWGAQLIWGNQRVRGGRLTADANAWATNVTWGAATTPVGHNIDLGVICTSGNCDGGEGTWERWGTTCADSTCSNVTWGNGSSENVVWGSTCGGANCSTPWTVGAVGSGLSGGSEGAAVVWGTSDGDAIVWGTSCHDASCEPVNWNDQ